MAEGASDRRTEMELIAEKLGCLATPEAIHDALIAKLQAARAANPRRDPSGPQIREKAVLKKFDHTPLPGEDVEPIETVIIEDGQITVLPGKGE